MSNMIDTDEKRVSYGIGRQMGEQLLASNIPDLALELVRIARLAKIARLTRLLATFKVISEPVR